MPFTSPFEDTLHVGGSAYRHASLALLADLIYAALDPRVRLA